MLEQSLTLAVTFPFMIFIFMHIVLRDYEKNSNANSFLVYLFFFITFLPIIWIPFTYRILYYFVGVFFVTSVTKRFNIYQSFWLTTLFFLMYLAIEAVLQTFLENLFKIITIDQYILKVFIGQLIELPLVGLVSFRLKKHYINFITKSQMVKNYQITYPLIILTTLVTFSLYMGLILTEALEFRANFHFSMIFAILILIIAVAVIILVDKYLKSKNDLERLNKRVSAFTSSHLAKDKSSIFEESIEFDLMNSAFCAEFLEIYEITELFCKGNNSNIYMLEEKATHERYTMKVIEKKKGIDYDFSVLKQIDNPSIMPVVNVGEGDKYHYIIKPYADGLDLDRYVAKHGFFSDLKLIKIARQLATILEALHACHEPIVYRDLKPSNIIFNPEDETIKLIDIESIRKLKSSKESDTFIIGSRGYTPPEQYGFSQTLPQSDIYAFGATLYYLATGVEPDFRCISDEKQSHDVSESLMAIIRKCMSFNPSDRYENLQEILMLI